MGKTLESLDRRQNPESSGPIDVDYFLSVDEDNNGSFMLQKVNDENNNNNKSSTTGSTPRSSLFQELYDYVKNRSWKKKLLTAILIVVCVVVFMDLIFGNVIRTWISSFLEWMSANSVLAVLAFIGFLLYRH